MTAPVREMPLAGWGGYPVEPCRVLRPEDRATLQETVASTTGTLIARGLGRSYGDASLNATGSVLLATRLDHLLAFDPKSGRVRCEAGVSLADLLDVFLPKGFFLPVTPGTKNVSLGGAIAADVHGKNHHQSGSMSTFVEEFALLLASGDVVRCARDERPELFWATLGGMGLTGVVLEATLRLRRVETGHMHVDRLRVPDLDAALAAFAADDARFDYSVAWVDCLSRGARLGRSVIFRANHAAAAELPHGRDPFARPGILRPRVPFRLPDWTLNPLSMGVFNEAFYRVNRSTEALVDCDRYFYPLDRVEQWNRVYGRRGVLQYQLQLPFESGRDGLVRILEHLSRARRASFLAVLKTFGPGSEGVLSFPRPGYTLSLDLPYTGPDAAAELRRMDAWVADLGGRIYLAKDACMDPGVFAATFPSLPRFQEIKAKVDPENRFASSQARRLGIVPAP